MSYLSAYRSPARRQTAQDSAVLACFGISFAAFRIEAKNTGKRTMRRAKASAYNAGCDLLWRRWLVFFYFFQELFDTLDVFLREVERKVQVRQSAELQAFDQLAANITGGM